MNETTGRPEHNSAEISLGQSNDTVTSSFLSGEEHKHPLSKITAVCFVIFAWLILAPAQIEVCVIPEYLCYMNDSSNHASHSSTKNTVRVKLAC